MGNVQLGIITQKGPSVQNGGRGGEEDETRKESILRNDEFMSVHKPDNKF